MVTAMASQMTNQMKNSTPSSSNFTGGDAHLMDRSTSLAVFQGIGERLHDIMKPGANKLTPRLQELLETMQQADDCPSIVPDMDASARAR